MRIQCMPIVLKVIFVLSTIVSVTDCCSSRILLLRQHTLQIKEHVVQMVNQLELQRQHEVDDNEPSPDPAKFAIDAGEILRMLPELELQGELASIATTERDSYTTTEIRSADEETTIATTIRAGTTTIGTTTTITTLATATGEPPPDDDSTSQMTSGEVAILDLNEAAPTTTATIPTMTTSKTTTSTTTTTTPSPTTTPITSTTSKLTPTGSTTTDGTSKPNISEDLSFKLPCDDMYTLNFCLNGGNCFRWAMSNSFSYCVCPDGYVGERCDSKTEDGVYVPMRPIALEPQLKTAHVVFSFPMLILLSTIYVLFGAVFMFRNVLAQRRKQQQQQLHLHNQRFFVSC